MTSTRDFRSFRRRRRGGGEEGKGRGQNQNMSSSSPLDVGKLRVHHAALFESDVSCDGSSVTLGKRTDLHARGDVRISGRTRADGGVDVQGGARFDGGKVDVQGAEQVEVVANSLTLCAASRTMVRGRLIVRLEDRDSFLVQRQAEGGGGTNMLCVSSAMDTTRVSTKLYVDGGGSEGAGVVILRQGAEECAGMRIEDGASSLLASCGLARAPDGLLSWRIEHGGVALSVGAARADVALGVEAAGGERLMDLAMNGDLKVAGKVTSADGPLVSASYVDDALRRVKEEVDRRVAEAVAGRSAVARAGPNHYTSCPDIIYVPPGIISASSSHVDIRLPRGRRDGQVVRVINDDTSGARVQILMPDEYRCDVLPRERRSFAWILPIGRWVEV